MLTRRDFIHAGCAAIGAALAQSIVDKAEANFRHGFISGAFGQTVINAGGSNLAFLNLANAFSGRSSQANWPSLLSSSGYPNTTLGSPVSNQVVFNSLYYGRQQIWWVGTGCLQLSPATIVYSGGAAVTNVSPSASGSVAFNFAMGLTGQPTQAAPIEFSFGFLIASVSSASGLVQFTTTLSNSLSQLSNGQLIQINNVTGLPALDPSTGTGWTISNIGTNTFTINNSAAYVGLVSTIGGGPGPQSEAILSQASPTWNFLTAGTYSGFSGLVWCRKSDAAAIIAGQLVNPDYVSTFKSLNPRFIRFMDFSGVQSDRSTNYTYRSQTTNLCWNGAINFVSAYYVGAIGAGDAYTCSNPSASGAGAYVDGEIVVGQITNANTGYAPTLNVGARGAAPIFFSPTSPVSNANSLYLNAINFSGTVPASGKIITFTFSGGGLGSTYNPTYTIQAGDTTWAAIVGHIATQFRADATLLAANVVIPFNGVAAPSSQVIFQYNPNIGSLGGSPLTATATDNASGTYNSGQSLPGMMAAGRYGSFTYSTLFGGWLSVLGDNQTLPGVHGGIPLEFYIELCTRSNTGLWLNVGQLWSASRISSTVTQIANSSVKELLLELSNETWNAFLAEWPLAAVAGCCLGMNNKSNPNDSANGWTGLKSILMAQQAIAAWVGAGRTRASLKIQISYQFVDMSSTGSGSTCQNRMQGANLNTSTNTTLASFGNNGQTALSINPSTTGNRPIDFSDSIGGAPYWCGAQFNINNGGASLNTGVPLASYNGALLAAYNYQYGTPTQQQAALDFLYSISGNSGDLYNGQLNGATNTTNQLANFELGSGTSSDGYVGIGTYIASFDSFRSGAGLSVLAAICYEGFHDSGPVVASETTGCASSLTTLGYTNGYSSGLVGAAAGGPTGSSDTAALAAANMTLLLTAFKNDNRFNVLTTKYLSKFQSAATLNGAHPRIALATTYGFEGPSVWALYPGSIYTTPYQSWNALEAF